MEYPDLETFLLVAEAVLDRDVGTLLRATRISLAESALAAPQASHFGVEHYPDPATQAAVLCSRIVRNHPLPDGNKRVGLILMLLFLETNRFTWTAPEGGQNEIADMIERLAGKEPRLGEAEFAKWVARHVT
jgi:death-on-curing protein